jgi:hypothetical protein
MSATDFENLESEKQRVAVLRSGAEPDDAQPKKDDYLIIEGKYRVVRRRYLNFLFNHVPPPSVNRSTSLFS